MLRGLSHWEAGDLLSGFRLRGRPTSCPIPVGAPSAVAQGVELSPGGRQSACLGCSAVICCVTCQKSVPLPLPTVK